MFQKIALLALAGSAGTLARYGLCGAVCSLNKNGFPWGTLVVNLIGCFAAGLVYTLFESRWPVAPETRTLVLVGFMGAFTTFSAFILETGHLVRASDWAGAGANVALQNGLGFAALFAGIALARFI